MDYTRITEMLDATFGWSVARTFSREEAEELTQEIMFQALKSLGNLRDGEKFAPWYWRLADLTFKVFKRGKAKNRNTVSLDTVAALAFEDTYPLEADEEYQTLRLNIARMSAAYRDIVVMRYYDGLSCKAISRKLGLPEGTVTYRLSLARQKIRKRCGHMDETALKPMRLKISTMGEGNYNGDNIPFPSQYIDDALSQNILWYAYREPQTVESLSEKTGVPAFYIEDRIKNLIKREAVIQPTKTTVLSDFLIFDEQTNGYGAEHTGTFTDAVSDEFFRLSGILTDKMLSSGIQTAGRSVDEIRCLLSVMLLDAFVPEYGPTEFAIQRQRYDGRRWEYLGFLQDGSSKNNTGIGMEKSMNSYESGKLAHYTYHFAPFTYRKMMFSEEIDVCQSVLQNEPLTEKQKEYAAKLIAEGYFKKDTTGEIVCAVPVFTKEQYALFVETAKNTFADFLPHYTAKVKKYLDGYLKLFPQHVKQAAERNGFHVFVALFTAITADWAKNGKIHIPEGAVCDALIVM